MTSGMPEKYSAEEWEHLRKRFSNSALKTTEVAELGRSVGVSWPFKGSDETPEKYIHFNFEELQSVPGLISKKKRIKDLMDILREILAFDDPFSDMTNTVDKRNEDDRVYKRVLKKLEISEDYPLSLMYFSPQTRKSLHDNGAKTLIQAIRFGQKTATKLENDKELQIFLNGLALIDEATMKVHLPIRTGHRGLHLAEAIGLMVRDLDKSTQLEFLYQSGIPLTDSELSFREQHKDKPTEADLKVTSVRFNELCIWFEKQLVELKQICKSTESVERYLLQINDSEIERVAMALILTSFGEIKATSKSSSIFGKLSGLFKR